MLTHGFEGRLMTQHLLLRRCSEKAAKLLQAAGYEHIKERDAWDLKPGGK